jgi:hypothetical protein
MKKTRGRKSRVRVPLRIENPSVWQIPMCSQIFPMRNMGRLCAKLLEKNSLLLSQYFLDMTNTVFQCFMLYLLFSKP